jgi:hypothetical protein
MDFIRSVADSLVNFYEKWRERPQPETVIEETLRWWDRVEAFEMPEWYYDNRYNYVLPIFY